MDLKKIFENNENWIADKLQQQPDYFNKLAEGQSPKILYIGCSDSRVTAEELMGASPGEVFVHRNIANMVISIDMNVMSVINYAVSALKVEQIIVCGHYGCGGVKAAMVPVDLGILNPWLRNVRDVSRMQAAACNKTERVHQRHQRVEQITDRGSLMDVVKS